MIKHLFKGILRDKNRSLLPIIVITIGVSLTILLSGYIKGIMNDIIDQNARFQTGHVKIMSRSYAENQSQIPNDLALLGVNKITSDLQKDYPQYNWVQRIHFGGLLDIPDQNRESKGQAPINGMAIDLLSGNRDEIDRLNIQAALTQGELPKSSKDALIGLILATKLHLQPGDEITYMGTDMNGSMTFQNLNISGIIRFGMKQMDQSSVIIDIGMVQEILNMNDGAGEILGYSKLGGYDHEMAHSIQSTFNAQYTNLADEFSPEMFMLSEQNNLGDYLEYTDSYSSIFIFTFVLIMSIVLWNTGLIGGLRRYNEFGIRLALGESKSHIYKTLILEAILIGSIGSTLGTIIGLSGVLYLQKYGIDISGIIKDSNMLMPGILKAKFTTPLLFIGFIPGLFAMVLGNMLSGARIYKRETASLFKELEV